MSVLFFFFVWVDKDPFVVRHVVVVFESHGASLEWDFLLMLKTLNLMSIKTFVILIFYIITLSLNLNLPYLRYLCALFQQVSSCNLCLREQLLGMFDMHYSFYFFSGIFSSLDIWISWTIYCKVTVLFATLAFSFKKILFGMLEFIFLVFFVWFVVDALMLSKFAACLVLASFSTAPPEFSTVCTPVSSTFPTKIFVFVVFFTAELTLSDQCINIFRSFFNLFQLLNS